MASITRPLSRMMQTGANALPNTLPNTTVAPRGVAMQLLTSRAFHISPPAEDSKPQRDEIKHAPGWREEHATDSEADVKADREPLPKDVHELQSETIENLRSKETLFDKVQEEAQHLQQGAQHMEESVVKGVKNTASTVKNTASTVKEAVVDSADFVAKAFVGGTDHSRIKKKQEEKQHH